MDTTMAPIPPNPVTMEEVFQWYKMRLEMRKLVAAEALLRPRIFKHFFPNAEEGVNNFVLPAEYGGFTVKGNRIISRDIDPGTLDAFRKPGPNGEPSEFQKINLNVDNYLRIKHELKVGEYRKLTVEELKVMDQCLVIKDGMPQLDIVPPAKNKK